MTVQVFSVTCSGPGGITLLDSSRMEQLAPAVGHSFNVALDPLGQTDVVADYPGRLWDSVWVEESAPVVQSMQQGQHVSAFLSSGKYTVSLGPTEETAGNGGKVVSGVVHVPSGRLIAVETGELVQSLLYPELSLEVLNEVCVGHLGARILVCISLIGRRAVHVTLSKMGAGAVTKVSSVRDLTLKGSDE